MSLLEDVFLQDEAGEAQELERIIEGDEYDERPRPSSPDSNDNSEKEDEAEEDKRHVDPTSAKQKRVVKNPRVTLNPARLTGPRGIQVIPEHFKDFRFKGKGHEKEDLDLVLKKLEHWAYRLFPKFEFKDCLKKIESLGNKRPVMVHLTKIRTDQFMSEETVVQRDSSDDETVPQPIQEEDEFDKLLQQQIELARATPAPGSTRKPAFSTPIVDKSISVPKAMSSPSINDEQRERMLRNRRLAEERRLARLKVISESNIEKSENPADNVQKDSDSNSNPTNDTSNLKGMNTVLETTENDITDQTIEIVDEEENVTRVKNRSNVIDSSDEDDALVINESVTVDVHDSHRNDDSDEEHISDRQNEDAISEVIEEIRTENDIEMSEVDNQTDSMFNENDNINEKPDNLAGLEALNVSKDIVEEINTNEIHSESLEQNNAKGESSQGSNKHITESNSNHIEDKQNKIDLGVKETDKQTVDNSRDEFQGMDVEFCDDF